MAELTFALEQEEVGAGAERGAEVGAVVHQVAGQALPVEVAHRVGAAGTGSGQGGHQGRDPQLPAPTSSTLASLLRGDLGAPSSHLSPCWDASSAGSAVTLPRGRP